MPFKDAPRIFPARQCRGEYRTEFERFGFHFPKHTFRKVKIAKSQALNLLVNIKVAKTGANQSLWGCAMHSTSKLAV